MNPFSINQGCYLPRELSTGWAFQATQAGAVGFQALLVLPVPTAGLASASELLHCCGPGAGVLTNAHQACSWDASSGGLYTRGASNNMGMDNSLQAAGLPWVGLLSLSGLYRGEVRLFPRTLERS